MEVGRNVVNEYLTEQGFARLSLCLLSISEQTQN